MKRLINILNLKCPRCYKGNMFKHSFLKKPGSLFEMHENCPHCGQKYEIETGFWFGAMYVAYGLMVAVAVATFVLYSVFIGFDNPANFLLTLAGIMVFLTPFMLRLSRAIWLSFFVKHKKDKE